LIVGSVVFGVTAWLIARAFTSPTTAVVRGTGMLPAEAVADHGAVGAVALPLFRDYVVGFEVTSLLLLTAIIGAILLAKRRV
jgi:NADH-quinone oxidoreductase subunit J